MKARHYQLLVLLGSMWGISFVLIKYAIEDFSPMATSVWRSLVAVAFISAIWAFAGTVRDGWAEIRRRPGLSLCLGALQIAVPFTLVHLGEDSIPAGVTGVLVATQVFFIGVLAPFLDQTERFNRAQIGGLMIGLVGVALVVGVDFIDTASGLVGALAVLGAALSYALGGFLVKLRYGHVDSRITAYVAVAGGAILMLPALGPSLPSEAPGSKALLSVLAIGIVGTALALALYCHLVQAVGAGQAALAAYLAPAFALLFGWLILDETISLTSFGGIVLIAVGVGVVGRSRRPPDDPGPEPGAPGPVATFSESAVPVARSR